MADVLCSRSRFVVRRRILLGMKRNDLYRLSRPARASNPGPASPCLKHVIIGPFLAVLWAIPALCATILFPIRGAIPSTGVEDVARDPANRRLP